jgi:hypothetical protein
MGLANAASRHATVHGIQDDGNPDRAETFFERIRYLFGQALLQLRTRGKSFDDPRQLSEPNHPRTGNVGEVRDPDKGEEVMLADRSKFDVSQQDKLTALSIRQINRFGQMIERVFIESAKEVGIRKGDPLRGRLEARARRIVADRR